MSHDAQLRYGKSFGFPRVSGDEPRSPRAYRVTVRFSLRERG